jgi:hypothetical protein
MEGRGDMIFFVKECVVENLPIYTPHLTFPFPLRQGFGGQARGERLYGLFLVVALKVVALKGWGTEGLCLGLGVSPIRGFTKGVIYDS